MKKRKHEMLNHFLHLEVTKRKMMQMSELTGKWLR